MPWNEATARNRIEALVGEVPDFDIQKFQDYLPVYEANEALRKARREPTTPPLFSLPKGRAVVVDTVQIYIAIANYDDFRLEEGEETEASHERAMRLLHFYYSAADRVIESSSAQRVDFHSGRVHAVILERDNRSVTRDTLAEALAFVEDFKLVAAEANRELARSALGATFRVGIDVGTCVAINNGTGCEQEPMFLGSAANYAAKLASGNLPGVYLSNRARSVLGLQEFGSAVETWGLSDEDVAMSSARRGVDDHLVFGAQDREAFTKQIVSNWRDEVQRGKAPNLTMPSFRFFYREPPLRTLDYSQLMPSNSVRMDMVSIFADLTGYTAYIDKAVASGRIRDAVRALYVIRQEFQNVVEMDFGGRKVRFIGDCIHAVIAEGNQSDVNLRESVSLAAECAGGLQSSFGLCQSFLGNLQELGLAIGLEIGPTPISRIGIRGDRSIRVASSISTTMSEKMQDDCESGGIKLGPKAMSLGPVALWDLVNEDGYAAEFAYRDVAVGLSVASPTIATPHHVRARVHTQPAKSRAHMKAK